MGDLQATIEFLVELYKFYNVDLFIRGYYQLRFTFKPPKCSHAVQVEVSDAHGESGVFTLFPAFITEDGQTGVSRTFNIYYKDEEVLLKDVFLFRVHLLIDSTKAADCIEKMALEMSVDVHFADQVVRETNYQTLPMVTSRTLTFHLSCFNGLHHQVPLLFDYYYFSVVDLIIHANIVSLGLPNWRILKSPKTGWFSKATPRTSSPMLFSTLFGNRYQLATQFYTDAAIKYALPSSSISRECFEKAAAVHRNLCAILAMAHSKLLNYFEEAMQYLDEKQRIKLGDKLDPADLVEGLCKKLETLQSCEEVFDEICSDLSILNNEVSLLWLQFQESFVLNDKIRSVLREQHHSERMLHFSEAFFVHDLPWKSLLNAKDSSAQKHASMGQCVKSSRYLSLIPPVTVECAEVDGDSSSVPIFFEDRYMTAKDASISEITISVSGATLEDEVLEHKPLTLGILNEAFHDNSLNGGLEHQDVVAGEEWVHINEGEKTAGHVTDDDNREERSADAVDNSLHGARDNVCSNETGVEEMIDNAHTEQSGCRNESSTPKQVAGHGMEDNTTLTGDKGGTIEEVTSDCRTQQDRATVGDTTSDVGARQQRTGSCKDLRGILEAGDTGVTKSNHGSNEGGLMNEVGDTKGTFFEDVMARVALNLDGLSTVVGGRGGLGLGKANEDTKGNDLVATSVEPVQLVSENVRTNVDIRGVEDIGVSIRNSADVTLESSVCYVGNDVDRAGETADRKKECQGMVLSSCDTEDQSRDGGAVCASDVKVIPLSAEGNVLGEHNIEPQGNVLGEHNIEEPQGNVSLSNEVIRDGGTGCEVESDEETTTQGAAMTDTDSTSDPQKGCHGNTAGRLTLEKQVDNSVFHERTSRNSAQVVSKEHDSSGEFLGVGTNLQDDTIASVKVTGSSPLADAVGCFCGGKLEMTSSPYRPNCEIEKTNLQLQKAKQEVKTRINYCGRLYSDLPSEFLVRPYFMDPKPDLSSEPVHFVVCVHGLDGNSGDLRLLRCFLEMTLPSIRFEFLMSEINQDNTFLPFEQLTEKLVSEILHHMEAYRVVPSRISFIGHSLGNIIIRSALTHPLMEPYVELFHTFLSLSGPHLGMIYHTSSLVSTGLWLMQKWKKSASLLQLSLNDSTDMRETFLYKLSKKKGLEYFTNVLLVSSVQDHYVPFHSSRIEMPKMPGRSNSQECSVYREMMENILNPLLSQDNRTLVRYSVYHCLPSSTNSFIGRAAHIAMLDSELFIEKLICRSAVKYFQ